MDLIGDRGGGGGGESTCQKWLTIKKILFSHLLHDEIWLSNLLPTFFRQEFFIARKRLCVSLKFYNTNKMCDKVYHVMLHVCIDATVKFKILGQTFQIQIRLKLREQFDQGLQSFICLLWTHYCTTWQYWPRGEFR